LVWELAAVLARCLTTFHISMGQEKGRLPLVCPSCTTCSVRSHGLILVFFVKIQTNSRTGCHLYWEALVSSIHRNFFRQCLSPLWYFKVVCVHVLLRRYSLSLYMSWLAIIFVLLLALIIIVQLWKITIVCCAVI